MEYSDTNTDELLLTLSRLRKRESIDFADEQMLNEEITLIKYELRCVRHISLSNI